MHSDRSQKRIKGCDYKLACRCDDNLAFKTIVLTLYSNFDLKWANHGTYDRGYLQSCFECKCPK